MAPNPSLALLFGLLSPLLPAQEVDRELFEKSIRPILDFHATVLHLLGMDHEKLTHRFSGRDFRLTDVAGVVAEKILA